MPYLLGKPGQEDNCRRDLDRIRLDALTGVVDRGQLACLFQVLLGLLSYALRHTTLLHAPDRALNSPCASDGARQIILVDLTCGPRMMRAA